MANEFYKPGEERAAKVNDLFAAIARRYDLLNDLMSAGLHRRWKRRLVTLAAVQPGNRALDVCCGTGDIVFALARRGASAVGVDFSEPMLAVGRARAGGQGSEVGGRRSEVGSRTATSGGNNLAEPRGPRFLLGDAQRLPFGDDSFEVVTVGYGLRNLASWEAGMREMLRVARPGGRLLVLDFGKPDHPLWRGIYFGYLRFVVPLMGWIFCGRTSAYGYILESLRHYPAQHGVAAKMRELGMRRVDTVCFLGGVMSINYGEKAGAEPGDG